MGKTRDIFKKIRDTKGNLTEACFLADMPYPLTKATVLEGLKRLSELCPQPIVTGLIDNGDISVYFTDKNGNAQSLEHENVEGFFHGAGDVFASAFVGCLARGKSERDAIQLSADFVTASIRRTAIEVPDKRYGLNFEMEIFPFLEKLNGVK